MKDDNHADRQKAALIILDGWGLGPRPEVDAIAQAHTPIMDKLMQEAPHSTLVTHGMDVGLPEGQMGNSEVGHLNIGAGRVVYQQFARINLAVQSGDLLQHEILLNHIRDTIGRGSSIHIMGLLSDGGVHSHTSHLKSLLEVTESLSANRTYVHAFLDGRDTDPNSGINYLRDLLTFLEHKDAALASIIGRYYAMDRDLRWERIKEAYDLIVHGKGSVTSDPVAALQQSYDQGVTDEFVKPIVCENGTGTARATLQDGDLLICFNFRTDRPRQISRVLTQEDFADYGMNKLDVRYVTMTRYDDQFKGIDVLFEKMDIHNTLGEVLSSHGKTQLRIAETEKYPHVTFFFSGGVEEELPGEERILIPSPKVATYDLKPEMSAPLLTEKLLDYLEKKTPDFICLNFANADMVGHTGVFSAAVTAAETVDHCLGQILQRLRQANYHVLILADHGNADYMVNEDGSPNTAHTKNPVPLALVTGDKSIKALHSGKLGDLAPTILTLMQLPIPPEMDGTPLLVT